MPITLNFPFTNPANYIYSSDEIDISSGKAKLALQQDDVDFTEDFADDTDFTYDSDKSEFSGGQVQKKDTRPESALGYCSFTENEEYDWQNGDGNNSLSGGAVIGDGRVDLTGADGKIFNMSGACGFNDVGTAGCIRFTYRPNYSGTPAITKQILEFDSFDGNNSAIFISHYSTGYIRVDLRDSSSVTHLLLTNNFDPIAGQDYIIELNFDFDGVSRLFINGLLRGSLNTSSWTRTSQSGNFKWGGATGEGDCYLDNIIVFDSVQHTGNHVPEIPFSYNTTIYIETSVILPEMEHVGDGTIKLFNFFSTIETGSPRYTLQIGRSGDYLYWNGSAWIVSDGSYDQANDSITFNTNCDSLPVDGEKYGQFKIIFQASNTQSSVSELTANMNVDIGYLATNPYGKVITSFRADELEGFFETAIKNGNDEITYILESDGDYYYWNGSAWITGSLTYNNSTTAEDIHTNRASLIDSSSEWYVYFFLHSDDGSSTPELDNIQIDYSYAGEEPDTIETCNVWGYYLNGQGNPLTSTITIRLNKYIVQYKDYTSIKRTDIEITPDDSGYWEVELVENENMVSPDGEDVEYVFDFGDGNTFERTVPNESTKAFYDLL